MSSFTGRIENNDRNMTVNMKSGLMNVLWGRAGAAQLRLSVDRSRPKVLRKTGGM